MALPVEFVACPPGVPPATELLDEMVDEMRRLYAISGPHVGPPLQPVELEPPKGVYLVGRVAGEVVAGGGLRLVTPLVAEIKRMYVRPAFRSLGLARALLGALEDEAVRVGALRARLDTGARQPHAQSLYQRCGYQPIGNWNDNPHAAFWGEKPLT